MGAFRPPGSIVEKHGKTPLYVKRTSIHGSIIALVRVHEQFSAETSGSECCPKASRSLAFLISFKMIEKAYGVNVAWYFSSQVVKFLTTGAFSKAFIALWSHKMQPVDHSQQIAKLLLEGCISIRNLHDFLVDGLHTVFCRISESGSSMLKPPPPIRYV